MARTGLDLYGGKGREREESDAGEEIAKQESLEGKEVAP